MISALPWHWSRDLPWLAKSQASIKGVRAKLSMALMLSDGGVTMDDWFRWWFCHVYTTFIPGLYQVYTMFISKLAGLLMVVNSGYLQGHNNQ